MLDLSLLSDSFARCCSHLSPTPMVAYALLAGDASSRVLGPLVAPKLKHWISVLLALPTGKEPVDPSTDDLIAENVALRKELELKKRRRTSNEFDVQGSVVQCHQGQDAVKDQWQRDKINILSTLHAVRNKIPFKHIAGSILGVVTLIDELDPNFESHHVFDDLGHRTTLTHAALNLADALDEFIKHDITVARDVVGPRGDNSLFSQAVCSNNFRLACAMLSL